MKHVYSKLGVTLLVLVMIITLPLASSAETKKFLIGYSQFHGTNPFLIAMTAGANKAIGEWKEKDVEVEMIITDGGDTNPMKQVADCEDIFAQGVDGLLIFPAGGSKLMSDPVRNLYNKNNIPVVVTDIGLENADWISFIITDNYLGGKMLAEVVAENVPEGAKIITFDNNPAAENCIARQNGFEDTAKELGLEVMPEKNPRLTLEDGRLTMEDTLVAIPDIAAVFHINQIAAQGSASALEAAGNTTTKLVAFDIDAPSLKMVKEGKILALTVQDPFLIGYEGMNQMLTYLTGGTPEKLINVPPILCTIENAADFDDNPQVQQ
jgi:ribose transport system substrate-binding protein